NTAVTDVSCKLLGMERRRKKPWDSRYVCVMRGKIWRRGSTCNTQKDQKDTRNAEKRTQNTVKKAKECWIGIQCGEIGTCVSKNNSKKEYKLVNDGTSKK
ncbi:MAG: hypothetical protein AB2693_26375, partial [Candidatus Thiodiazotropha sp.]